MSYTEDDYLQISGIQHFVFCRRQWALIHIEQQWEDNVRTVEGNIIHERAHDASLRDRTKDRIIIRGLRVSSPTLGVSGICDVVEFQRDDNGISLDKEQGRWKPYPIEYKRGVSKLNDADRLQLCVQAMCLEEMLGCSIPEGAIYYGATRRREAVLLYESLRESAERNISEMHAIYSRGYTPKVKTGKHCNACSLKGLCLPVLCRSDSAVSYIKNRIKEGL